MSDFNYDENNTEALDKLTKKQMKDLIYAAMDNKDWKAYDILFKYFKDKFQNE